MEIYSSIFTQRQFCPAGIVITSARLCVCVCVLVCLCVCVCQP